MRAPLHPSAPFLRLLAAATLVAWAAPLSAQGTEPSSGAIDAQVWTTVSTTVVAHDLAGMAATYHPAAVLVTPQGTMPIARALAGWGQAMEAMKRNGSQASVAFRFSLRQDGAETAFESGMFNYAVTDSAGATTRYIIPFEALLVRQDSRWLIVMERQFAAADEAAWNALAR
jgi:ketosteroid isomerase-like protein